MFDIKELEEAIVLRLKPLEASRKIFSFSNPEDYENRNIPVNGLGIIFVSFDSLTNQLPENKKFGPITTQPNTKIKLVLIQRGNYSHKSCYPTLKAIVELLNGYRISGSPLILTAINHTDSDKKDKCWMYELTFNYIFDLISSCENCC